MRAAPHDKNHSEPASRDLAPDGRGRLFASSPAAPRPSQEQAAPDELQAFLSLVAYDDAYRVDAVLKESPYETTQRVYYEDGQRSLGPFVRKYLKLDSGLGAMYETIRAAQEAGQAFAHLPRIHACYRLKDDLVVIMEHVSGETLQDVVYRRDPSPELAAEVFPLACEAVRELHERFDPPIIHRDLKPSNLILSWDRLTLIDFGIARRYDAERGSDTVHFGTRDYAPPEQFGFRQTDVRSDVYALGMILHYLLTERTAQAKDREAHFAHSSIPEEFRAVIDRACAFDPDERYASVAELEVAFGEAVAAHRAPLAAGPAPADRRGPGRVFGRRERLASRRIDRAAPSRRSGGPQGGHCRLSVPRWAGIVWNVCLLLTWLLFTAATFCACFDPNAQDAGLPLWFRVFEYPVVLGVSFTVVFYVLMDRRALRRRFPRLGAIPVWAEFVAAFGVVFVLFVVLTIVANAFVL